MKPREEHINQKAHTPKRGSKPVGEEKEKNVNCQEYIDILRSISNSYERFLDAGLLLKINQ